MRKEIEKHLSISSSLDKAVGQITNAKDIQRVAMQHGITSFILKKKFEIIESKISYFNMKCLMDKAVYDIKINGILLSDAAKKYKLEATTLVNEIYGNKLQLKLGIYIYDPLTMDNGYFRFSEEYAMLEKVKCLKKIDMSCKCRICILEYLSELAYKRAHSSGLFESEDERMNISWIREFEMRHSIDISNKFSHECSMTKTLC